MDIVDSSRTNGATHTDYVGDTIGVAYMVAVC